MTAFDVDSVPAPSDVELAAMDAANAKRREFKPFVGVTDRDHLVVIVAETHAGLYRDTRGYLYIPATITSDLGGYAERRAAARDHQIQDEDARDQAATFADALR